MDRLSLASALAQSIAALLQQCRSTSPDDRRVVVAQGTKRLLPDVAAYLGLPEHAALDRDLTRALRQPISELVMLPRTDDLTNDDERRAADTAWAVVRIVDGWIQDTTIERRRPRSDDGMAPVGAFKL